MTDLLALAKYLKLEPAAHVQTLNPAFELRYPQIPPEYLDFLQRFVKLETPDETTWFNSTQDFNEDTLTSKFAWNEFELQSLEALAGDAPSQSMIRDFWNAHLPIVLSVRHGYAYFAIGVADHNWGQIFYGEEPEYEETVCIANSFLQWIQALAQGRLEEKYAALLSPAPQETHE